MAYAAILGALMSQAGGQGGQSNGQSGVDGYGSNSKLGSYDHAGNALIALASGLLTPNMRNSYADYANQLHGLANKYAPWVTLGMNNNQSYSQHNMQDVNNPTGEMDAIASHWKSSPYQQNMMHGVSGMMNSNAAQTGMLGSMSANNHLQDNLTNMVNQYQNQYVNQGLGQYNHALYNQGMLGQQGLNALGSENALDQEGYLGSVQANNADAGWKTNLYGGIMGALKG